MKKHCKFVFTAGILLSIALFISACGSSSSSDGGGGTSYTIGGTVSGLLGAGLVLQNNSGDDKSITTNSVFVFATAVATGGSYSVSVKTQPLNQTCMIANGSGTVAGADVTNVSVTCTTNSGLPTYTIGGAVTNLTGTGLILQNNSGDDKSITAIGAFVFSTAIATGGSYSVTIKTQPSGQTCAVSNGSGTVAGADVTNVSVTCTTNSGLPTYTIGGTVTNLAGTGLILQNNNGDDKSITANGAFVFSNAIATGGSYNVTIKTQPSGQTCAVSNGSGTVSGTNVANVAVTCSFTAPAPPTVASSPTPVTTTTQGAQAGAAGFTVAQSISSAGGMLSSLVGLQAPKLKLPFAASAVPNEAIASLTANVKPISGQAMALRSTIMSAGSMTTITHACENTGGTEAITMDLSNPNASDVTVVMNNCRKILVLYNGTLIYSGSNNDLTIGSTSSPFVSGKCTATACTAFDETTTAVEALTYSQIGTAFTTTVNGWTEKVNYRFTPTKTDHVTMIDLTTTEVVSQASATLISGSTATFSVSDVTVNGSISNLHTETGNNYGESDTFSNFRVRTMSDPGATTSYYSIDGSYAIALNPTDKCIEGTFSFETIIPAKVNTSTGQTVDGHMTVNGADVVFNVDGTVSINVNGTTDTYSELQLNSLCAL